MRADTMDDTELCFLSAMELRHQYRRRKLSPVEVTDALLRRMEYVNPDLVAFITVTADAARAAARKAERDYGPGGTPGLLAGIPISIKDLTPTKGIRTTRGSLLYADWVPDEDAPFVERIHAEGAVLIGKTNTPEFGWMAHTANRVAGTTRNPWDTAMSAGGSSGGAAAAVAAGLGPLAQGSDGGGSIRIPASFCGIFGHKPSFGLVPQYPPSAFGDLSHLGPMTRTVRDAALLLDVVAGGDARDRWSWTSGVNHLAACDEGVTGLRIAWSPDLGFATVDPAVQEATERAARQFERLGCHVSETSPNLPRPDGIWWNLWTTSNAAVHIDDLDDVRDQIDPGRLPLIEQGRAIGGDELARQRILRSAYYAGMQRFMRDYDLLLTPTLSRTAIPSEMAQPGGIAGKPPANLGDWTPFCAPFNLTGQPAATVPCGFDAAGLPIGLQLVGRWHDDATVLRAAAAYESVAPWSQHRPPLSQHAGIPASDPGQ